MANERDLRTATLKLTEEQVREVEAHSGVVVRRLRLISVQPDSRAAGVAVGLIMFD